jgi:hypothetical protein
LNGIFEIRLPKNFTNFKISLNGQLISLSGSENQILKISEKKIEKTLNFKDCTNST